MNYWVEWYENVMGFKMFKHFDDADISTEFSALMSKVMASGNHLIKMPINEPAEGKKKSQIQEYLEWHNMVAGCQHLAMRTDDELASVAELRRRGVDFLKLPDTYYEQVWRTRRQDSRRSRASAGQGRSPANQRPRRSCGRRR